MRPKINSHPFPGRRSVGASVLLLPRPLISSVAGGIACAAYYSASHAPSWPTAMLVFAVATLTSGFGFTLNDIVDSEKDRFHYDQRLIPSGFISARRASVLAIALVMISATLSTLLGLQVLTVNILALSLLAIYSPINNRHGLAANLITALNCALLLIFAMAAARSFSPFLTSMIPSILLLITGREILLDVRDLAADQRIGKTSIPLTYGVRNATVASLVLVLAGSIGFLLSGIIAQRWIYTILLVPVCGSIWGGSYLLWGRFTANTLEAFFILSRTGFAAAIVAIAADKLMAG